MNILVLCTYPIKNPKHGGQLRVRNIVDAYIAAGHKVEVVGVLGSDQYDAEEGFLPYPTSDELRSVISNPFLMEDYAIGCLFADRDKHYARLASTISIRPDVIQIEHPWLFAFAKRYVDSCQIDSKIVYSSHNIEWRLKKTILASYLDKDVALQYADLIERIEINAIAGANVVACVSAHDVDWVKSQTDKTVVLAPNGVKAWQASEIGCKEAVKIINGYRYALYCASAHPPNMTGFFDMFGGGFGSLKPDERLVVAGGAGWAIAGDSRVHQSPKLAEKVVVAGMVSQPCLEGLLEGAHCIVLPLTQGGGTNLKTAEALWSGKHVVATSVAMRGFEHFIGSKGVNVVDDSAAFKRMLRHAMSSKPLKLTDDEMDARSTVLWGKCLNSLVELINKFSEGVNS